MNDNVKNPKHYQLFDGIESIEIIARSMTVEQFRGFCLGCALKYRIRAGKKDDALQDIAKADQFEILFKKYRHLCWDYEVNKNGKQENI
ncbi:DUF3310 domain-containing protein [Gilliamella apicola]|uniref:DUF3310 domain-containing protein n=1 Tax=Gilliamella apicola TaxID=1196095 RepID=UPI002FEE30E3